MTVARLFHNATLLPSGKVLVAGGYDLANYLQTAERYDPVTNTWSAASSMATPRSASTATLLPSGKVLIAGGDGPATATGAAEFYDPILDTWSSGGTMSAPRGRHTATVLPGGKVLVTGGENNSIPLSGAELYDPIENNWSPAGSMATARFWHTATLLPDGAVLVVGGYPTLPSAELYDPIADAWVASSGSKTNGRFSHTATLLSSGRVFVAGGGELRTAEIYDPAPVGSRWTPVASMAYAGGALRMTLLANGKVLATGVYNLGGYQPKAELYDPATDAWTSVPNMLNSASSGHSSTLLQSGKVLIAGGAVGAAEVYNPDTNSWSPGGALSRPRALHTATLLLNGKVLITGGLDGGEYLLSAELYDPATNIWTSAGSMGSARVLHTATLLSSGRVLVAGSFFQGSGYLATAEIYDPATNSWTPATSMSSARGEHTAVVLASGKVLAVGGYNGGSPLATAELYDPIANSWSAAGSLVTARMWHTMSALPGGRVLAAGGVDSLSNNSNLRSVELYDPVANTWSSAVGMGIARTQAKSVLLTNGKLLVAGGHNDTGDLASTELYGACDGDNDGDCFVDLAPLSHLGPANASASMDNCPLVANPSQQNADGNFTNQTPPSTQDDKTWPMSDAAGDACDSDDDNDGLIDAAEASGAACNGISSDPVLRDTDGDRVLDGAECVLGTSPASAGSKPTPAQCGPNTDTDGDRLSDRAEVCGYNTSITNADSDGDKAIDGARDGCEAASVNGDRAVNSGDQLLVAKEIARQISQTLRIVSMDLNKDGGVNSGDQLMMVGFISVLGSCP